MQLSRHFTKVRTAPRNPLGFRPFLNALDDIILEDATNVLRFALNRDTEAPTAPGHGSTTKKET